VNTFSVQAAKGGITARIVLLLSRAFAMASSQPHRRLAEHRDGFIPPPWFHDDVVDEASPGAVSTRFKPLRQSSERLLAG